MTDDAPRHDTASQPSAPADVQPPLAAILDSIPDLLFACDPAGRLLFLNQAAGRAFGLQPGAVLGRDLHEVVPASLTDRLATARHNGDGRRPDGFETFLEPPGRWLQVRCFPGPDGGLTVSCRDITEGRAHEEELRASEARYRAMVEDQTEILCRHRPTEGTYTYVNEVFCRFFGRTREELLGRPWHPEAVAEDREAVRAAIARISPREPVVTVENRVRDAAGRIRWIQVNNRGLFDDQGRLVEIQAVGRDITERKQLIEALQASENRFRQLFEQHSAIMFLIDPHSSRILDANPAAARFYGYPREALRQMELGQINCLPRDQITRLIRQVEQRQVDHLVNPHRLADGTVRTVEVFATPISLQEQTFNFAIIHDITERQQAEDELRRAEAYARSLIEVNLDPLVTIGPDGRISDVNEATVQATGCSRDELIGTDFSLYFTSPYRAQAACRQVFSTGAVRDFPLELRHRDGRITPVLYNGAVFRDETGKVAGVFASARDVTRLKEAEEALKAANRELEHRVEARTLELQETYRKYLHAEKLSAIGKLSASIAHEFNNPLQGVMTVLKGLRKRAVLADEDRALLEAAIGESMRMKDLIRSLQDFNRPSSGLRRPMDVQASLESLLLFQKSDLKDKRIRVERDYAPGLPPIVAVPDQIKQVFLNLLTNAADACQQPECRITVQTRLEGERVAVAISDTGIGIRPEAMEAIFEPFYTTKPAVKGTGLGLPVSYGIVRNHGGEIRVTSRPGEGSTFTVLLPVAGGGAEAGDR